MITAKLKALKEKSGLTVAEWSRKSNIPEDTINKILQGSTKDPRFQTIVDLVLAAGGSIDELIELEKVVIGTQGVAESMRLADVMKTVYEDRIDYMAQTIAELRVEHKESIREQYQMNQEILARYRESCDKRVATKDKQMATMLFALITVAVLLVIVIAVLAGYIVYDATTEGFGFFGGR